jgi:hypothetical protein
VTTPNMVDIERAKHLIPGYLKKTLSGDDKEWMAQFLNTVQSLGAANAAATEFTQEMAWVQRTQEHLAQSSPAFDAQAGWQRMQNRLATPSPASAPQRERNVLQWIKAQFRARVERLVRLWQKPIVAATASAMIIGQMGLLAAVVRYTYNVEPQAAVVAPASGSKTGQDTVVLALVFKDKATAEQMRKLLDSVQAQVVGGPGAIGVWEVAVPKDKLNEAMKAFNTSKILESVTPQ